MATKKGHYYYTKEEIDEKIAPSSSSKYITIGDVLICWGKVNIITTGGPYGEGSAAITFPKQFSNADAATLTLGVKDAPGYIGEYTLYSDLTQSGAKIWAGHIVDVPATSMTVGWMAIGPKA